MAFQSSTNNYFRSTAQLGYRQRIKRSRALDLPGGILLWKAVAKIVLCALPVVLVLNLFCSYSIHAKAEQIAVMENQMRLAEQNNIVLRTQRATFLAPENIQKVAAEKLALFEPSPEQIIPVYR